MRIVAGLMFLVIAFLFFGGGTMSCSEDRMRSHHQIYMLNASKFISRFYYRCRAYPKENLLTRENVFKREFHCDQSYKSSSNKPIAHEKEIRLDFLNLENGNVYYQVLGGEAKITLRSLERRYKFFAHFVGGSSKGLEWADYKMDFSHEVSNWYQSFKTSCRGWYGGMN